MNKNIWNLYKESEKGKDAIALFTFNSENDNLETIPDFVFLPRGEIHFQNAPMIIEAKFDMSSNIEKTKSYNQALSYERLMKSSILGICDKDRLIFYKEKNGYFERFNPTFEKYWQNINDAETFSQLKLLI